MARAPAMEDDDPMKTALATLEHGGVATLPGGQVVSERTIFGDIITAQPCKVARNEPNVLRRVDAMAQANGEAWYYRFPVRNRRTGKVDYIEGHRSNAPTPWQDIMATARCRPRLPPRPRRSGFLPAASWTSRRATR